MISDAKWILLMEHLLYSSILTLCDFVPFSSIETSLKGMNVGSLEEVQQCVSDVLNMVLEDSKGFWWWCITFKITGFLDFFHCQNDGVFGLFPLSELLGFWTFSIVRIAGFLDFFHCRNYWVFGLFPLSELLGFWTFSIVGITGCLDFFHCRNYWVFGLFPLSGILGTGKHYILETGSVSVLSLGGGEDTYSVGSLRQCYSHSYLITWDQANSIGDNQEICNKNSDTARMCLELG
jgi:hypothetical protein